MLIADILLVSKTVNSWRLIFNFNFIYATTRVIVLGEIEW